MTPPLSQPYKGIPGEARGIGFIDGRVSRISIEVWVACGELQGILARPPPHVRVVIAPAEVVQRLGRAACRLTVLLAAGPLEAVAIRRLAFTGHIAEAI